MADADTIDDPLEIISRSDAKAAGLVRFFTGIPCIHGHLSERYVSTKGCVTCTLSKSRWSPGKAIRAKRWRAKYVKERSEKRKIWRKNNPEKEKEYARTTRQRRKALGKPNRRALSRSVKISAAFDLIILQKGRCAHCAIYLDGKFHVDHIVPLSKGGADARKNFQLLCGPCNIKKSAKSEDIVSRNRGLLI